MPWSWLGGPEVGGGCGETTDVEDGGVAAATIVGGVVAGTVVVVVGGGGVVVLGTGFGCTALGFGVGLGFEIR